MVNDSLCVCLSFDKDNNDSDDGDDDDVGDESTIASDIFCLFTRSFLGRIA